MIGRWLEADAVSEPAGGGAAGAAGADDPATTCGAGVASGAAACAMGAGASYVGALTGRLAVPAGGGVGGPCGSGGCGGGIAPAVAESGVPACTPLSKLCIKSAGVTGCT